VLLKARAFKNDQNYGLRYLTLWLPHHPLKIKDYIFRLTTQGSNSPPPPSDVGLARIRIGIGLASNTVIHVYVLYICIVAGG
jgi:hypothetical protein